MTYFSTLTPEQRLAMRAKSAATREANKAKRAEAAAAAADEPVSLADLGLGAQVDDPLDGVLSAEEIGEIRRQAKANVESDRRAKAKKALLTAAMDEYRRAGGDMPAGEEERLANEELVTVNIIMPTLRKAGGGGDLPPEPIIIDQKIFVSGRSYTVPLGQAVYLSYLMDQAKRHVNQVDGRSRTYYHEGTGRIIYQGGPASGGQSGPSFDSIHRRTV